MPLAVQQRYCSTHCWTTYRWSATCCPQPFGVDYMVDLCVAVFVERLVAVCLANANVGFVLQRCLHQRICKTALRKWHPIVCSWCVVVDVLKCAAVVVVVSRTVPVVGIAVVVDTYVRQWQRLPSTNLVDRDVFGVNVVAARFVLLSQHRDALVTLGAKCTFLYFDWI